MIHLIRALVIGLLAANIFGCVTSGEMRQLRQEVAAAEEGLDLCWQNTERAEKRLAEAEQKMLAIQRGVAQPTVQMLCNNCVNPNDTPQCAEFCVIATQMLWDPKRPHPSKAECAQLMKGQMTLATAQDIRTCHRDAYTEGVVEMQDRRHEERKTLDAETELLRQMWRHEHCNDCTSPPDTSECRQLCWDGVEQW